MNHHGHVCCERAREWVRGMAVGLTPGTTAMATPGWLARLYARGPSPRPLYWCEAVVAETLDAALFVRLACEAFAARGIAACPGRIVRATEAPHDVCVVVIGIRKAALYDPAADCWLHSIPFPEEWPGVTAPPLLLSMSVAR